MLNSRDILSFSVTFKGNPNFQGILTESYKYCIIIAGSNIKTSKTHRLLNKMVSSLSAPLSVYCDLCFFCLPQQPSFFSVLGHNTL